MATIEEIDDLNDASVEIINGVNSEEEATKETQSSPTRAETVEEIVPVPTTAVVPSRQEAEDSDEEDEVMLLSFRFQLFLSWFSVSGH